MAERRANKYLVKDVSRSKKKNGEGYLRLQLSEKGGKVYPAVFWEDKELKVGQVVDCLAEENEYNGTPQLTIHAMRVLDEKAGDEFLQWSAYSIDAMMEELLGFVRQVSDPKIGLLLATAVEDPRWRRAPAAKSMHHAFLGGLLEHVVNLCRLAHAVCALYPRVKRDLVVAGCVLHDIGKMDEMACESATTYTDAGELHGHIVIGAIRVDRWMEEMKFETDLRRQILHIILSHHGQLAYGSPKVPMTVEAAVFCKLDGLDADLGGIFAAIDKTAPDKSWTDKVGFKERYYLGERP